MLKFAFIKRFKRLVFVWEEKQMFRINIRKTKKKNNFDICNISLILEKPLKSANS